MLKEKIELDTNCLVMSLSAHNPYAEIRKGRIHLMCVQ